MYDDLPESRVDEVTALVRLEERIGDKVSKYSLGMRQRLGLAQAMLNSPRLLVLDEPTNGLDPVGIKELRDILKTVAHTEGVTVFISSHLLSELDQLCDRVAIIDRGRVLGSMTMDEIRHAGGEGNDCVSFTFLNPQKATEILRQLEIPYTVDPESGRITATMRKGTSPEAIRLLSEGGALVLSAIPVERSLEEVLPPSDHILRKGERGKMKGLYRNELLKLIAQNSFKVILIIALALSLLAPGAILGLEGLFQVTVERWDDVEFYEEMKNSTTDKVEKAWYSASIDSRVYFVEHGYSNEDWIYAEYFDEYEEIARLICAYRLIEEGTPYEPGDELVRRGQRVHVEIQREALYHPRRVGACRGRRRGRRVDRKSRFRAAHKGAGKGIPPASGGRKGGDGG